MTGKQVQSMVAATALLKQHRLLGVNLGRPFLIPQQFGVRSDASRDSNQISNPELGMNDQVPQLSLAYLYDLT
jgi:hypothetical protein